MAKDNFAVWSPHRDSASVLAFKSLLGLRSERWVWHDQAQQASWWIVDGSRDVLSDLTQKLIEEKALGPMHGALLAPSWSAVKNPIWTFFKVPLQVNQIYRWIDAASKLLPESTLGLSGQQIKLLRWPNMTRYSVGLSLPDSMQLTTACARLLKDWVSFEEITASVNASVALNILLKDALRDGFLTVAHAQPAALALGNLNLGSNPVANDDRGAWSLVKRLIQKFR